ncbi:hypothetical protein LCGC14_3019380, partial [marine sediment metagenome]
VNYSVDDISIKAVTKEAGFVLTFEGKVLTYTEPVIDTTNFYVKNGGNDLLDGNTPATAWQTIAKVNSETFNPGDQILFNKNDEWRLVDDPGGDWNMSWIGEENNHMTFGAYGTGDKPRLLGSDVVSSWTSIGDTIWWTYKASLDTFPQSRIFFELVTDTTVWGILEADASKASLDTVYEYYYILDTIYIRHESVTSPSTFYSSIEIPQVENIIEIQTRYDSAEYYTFDGFEIAYCKDIGIRNDWPGGINGQTRQVSGLEIRNCHIHHIAYKGSVSGVGIIPIFSDVIIEDNEINDCGRRAISFNIDGSGNADTCENIIIRNNNFHDGWHTTGLDLATASTMVYDIQYYNNTHTDSKTISLTA